MTFCSAPLRKGHNRFGLPENREVQLARSINELPARDWDKVTKNGSYFLRRDYLGVMEQEPPSNVQYWYALAYENGKPVVALFFQVIRLDEELLGDILKPVGSRKYLGFISGWRDSMRLLVSGNNFVSGAHGIAFADDFSPTEAFRILSQTVRILLKEDRDGNAISAVLVKDFEEPAAKQARILGRSKYYPFHVEPSMVVPLQKHWTGFDDYLQAMSKKYRNRAKTVLRKSDGIDVRELSAEDVKRESAELHRLYMHLHHKASFRMASLPETYFAAMKATSPGTFHIHGYYLRGKLIGFRSAFITGAVLDAHFIGIDYSVNQEYALYQRILYDFIHDGIRLGLHSVHLGRTASAIKSTVGAEPHQLTCYIRHRNSFTNHLLRHFIEYLEPEEWVQRHPFKEQESEPEPVLVTR